MLAEGEIAHSLYYHHQDSVTKKKKKKKKFDSLNHKPISQLTKLCRANESVGLPELT